MKNIFFRLLFLGFILSVILGCGNSMDSSSTLTDIVLYSGERQICTNATSFAITPTDNPAVTFSTDTSTKDTTISVEQNSSGYITISNCTKK